MYNKMPLLQTLFLLITMEIRIRTMIDDLLTKNVVKTPAILRFKLNKMSARKTVDDKLDNK